MAGKLCAKCTLQRSLGCREIYGIFVKFQKFRCALFFGLKFSRFKARVEGVESDAREKKLLIREIL